MPPTACELWHFAELLGQAEQACAAYGAVSAEYPKAVDARKRAQANEACRLRRDRARRFPSVTKGYGAMWRWRCLGWLDSIGLLRLTAAWAQLQSNAPRISVSTVDHGLRDASVTRRSSGRVGRNAWSLSHHTLVWSGPKPGTGIQSKVARRAMTS